MPQQQSVRLQPPIRITPPGHRFLPARLASICLLIVLASDCKLSLLAAERNVLPGTEPLTWDGDIASRLVEGADLFLRRKLDESVLQREQHWRRDTSSPDVYWKSIEPQRARLSHILGMRDSRPTIAAFEYVSSTSDGSLLAAGPNYDIHIVRWPSIGGMYGEGLLLTPRDSVPTAYIVALPDADHTPEQLCGLSPGIPGESQFARRLAESGCMVVIPALISRGRNQFEFNGRRHGISHREFLYRSAFEMGRHVIGYELQKIAAAVDVLSAAAGRAETRHKIGMIGYGEGGMLALYAAALDRRIDATVVSGYWNDRNTIWEQPIERNVFGLLEQFGDAELATMVAPRRLIIEHSTHPDYELPPGTGGAPTRIITPDIAVIDREVARARTLLQDSPVSQEWLSRSASNSLAFGAEETLQSFLAALSCPQRLAANQPVPEATRELPLSEERLLRQMRAMDQHTQNLLRDCGAIRQKFMEKLDTTSLTKYRETVEPYREYFRHEVVGHFGGSMLPPSPRTRLLRETERVSYYEVVLDVFPELFAYGILCLPRDIVAGEQRPVVVCQHGLEGRPQSTIGEQDAQYYQAFATRLAEQGFITFAPQNLYIFEDRFRSLQRKAYPLKKTLFSLIVPQHQQIVDWLQSLPMVDPERVAFYGLSYGGKTAMRVPPLVTDYCMSICSADFNEWVDKNASTSHPRSYVWTGEYEIFEWDLGNTFNYAEMAALIAPRPFMVERGHFDGVADDWTVAWEYAKVRHLYAARLNMPSRTRIEWFVGPHTIHGVGTFDFLREHLQHK